MGKYRDKVVRVLKKMHLNKIIYKILKRICFLLPNYRKDIDWDLLENYPDNGKSAVHINNIEDKLNYDLQIIVPVYNCEKYVARCINSVLHQKTKYSYLLIIVNDGSTDCTGDILNQYKNIINIKIIEQRNKGFSGARNTGLQNIYSNYIMFLDSDDELYDNAIDNLLDVAYSENVDIVEGGYLIFNDEKVLYEYKHETINSKLYSLGDLYGFPWGKVFRSMLFKNIQFPENYWFEDTILSFLIYPKTHISTVNNYVYYYRQNKKGITFTSRGNKKNIDSLWITRRILYDLKVLNIQIDENIYESFLHQVYVNYSRINSIHSKKINFYVFNLTVYLLNKFFKGMVTNNVKYKDLEKSLITNNYKLYSLYCSLL